MDEQQTKDRAAMWCDLLLAHNHAESAHFAVTRRAELYVRAAGLPVEQVYDALKTDATGWAARLADLQADELVNRRAAAWYDAERVSS